MIPLLDDRDKTVRDEAKLLLVEIYRWIGKQTLMPMIQNVKPIQVNKMMTIYVCYELCSFFDHLDSRVTGRV